MNKVSFIIQFSASNFVGLYGTSCDAHHARKFKTLQDAQNFLDSLHKNQSIMSGFVIRPGRICEIGQTTCPYNHKNCYATIA